MLMVVAMALLAIMMMVLMLMLMVVAMALLAIMMMVLMLVVVAVALFSIVVMVVLMMMLRFSGKARQLGLQSIAALHGLQELCACKIVPRRGHDNRRGIMLLEQSNGDLNLGSRHGIRMRENDASGVFNLIVKELAEILHVHLALSCVNDRGKATKNGTFIGRIAHGTNDIRKLAHTRGLDENTVGRILLQHLRESLGKVPDKRATDASGVHFIDLHACLRKEAAVDTNLTELVLNKHQLLAGIGLGDQFFNESCLAGSQEAGKNVNFCHV